MNESSNSRFRMPAEWEPHEATWLTWPHDEAHWPGKFEKIPPVWARMVKELESGEDIHILLHSEDTKRNAIRAMDQTQVVGRRVHLHIVLNNFSWARDHGPIFVKNHEGVRKITHWDYNAWGRKWRYDLDRLIPEHVSRITNIPRIKIPMVLEGGSIDVNGLGALLTTESCLLNPNRNPNFNRATIEKHLRTHLGVTKIIWLGGELSGDDTDGHVDDLSRFIGPNTILTMLETHKNDENYKPLQENLQTLQNVKDQNGDAFDVVEVALPSPVSYEGERLPASYANFYIGNSVVLLPIFNDPNDTKAVDTLAKAFPTRTIIPIDSRDLVWGLGAFHCVTQQMPL